MKTPRFFYSMLAGCLVLAGLALWPQAGRAASTTNAPADTKGKPAAKAGTGTNSVKAPLPIAGAVFDVAVAPTKDPFFPNSLRRPIRAAKEVPGVTSSAFQLMALSGGSNERLAMINHRTFGIGETNEVAVPAGGKVTIRLLQIKESSVIIRVITPPQPDLIELLLGGDKGKGVYIGAYDATHPQQ
jgi:hypothetical protein